MIITIKSMKKGKNKKHFWFGMEWSMAYYLAYNCTGKPLKPECVFEVGGNIDFEKEENFKEIWYLNKPRICQNKLLKDLALLVKPWKCSDKSAEFIYRKYFKKRPKIEYYI